MMTSMCRGSSADMSSGGGVQSVDLAPGVRASFTGARIDRVDDANLAHHRPHVPERLASAREVVGSLTATDPVTWHFMRQVHGASVAVVDGRTPIGAELRDVDVIVTSLSDRPLVVLAADCIPILAAGSIAIGAAHAGWRGLRADVPAALVGALDALGDRPGQLRVALGPAIGPCCYEVGPEVVAAIASIDTGAVTESRRGTPSVDLRAAARTRLFELGVTDVIDVADGSAGSGCTSCGEGWFSHRRDPAAGRQAGIVVRRQEVR